MESLEIDETEMGVSAPSKSGPDLSCSTIFKNIIIHLLTGGFTAFLTYLSFVNGITLFSWHAPLMSFGVSTIKVVN